jgi:nuclear transport factor 2 (NTF2) superfamily protein
MDTRPPLPPFTQESAKEKVQLAENGWNSRSPEKVALAYTVDSEWRNRAEIFSGRSNTNGMMTQGNGTDHMVMSYGNFHLTGLCSDA